MSIQSFLLLSQGCWLYLAMGSSALGSGATESWMQCSELISRALLQLWLSFCFCSWAFAVFLSTTHDKHCFIKCKIFGVSESSPPLCHLDPCFAFDYIHPWSCTFLPCFLWTTSEQDFAVHLGKWFAMLTLTALYNFQFLFNFNGYLFNSRFIQNVFLSFELNIFFSFFSMMLEI